MMRVIVSLMLVTGLAWSSGALAQDAHGTAPATSHSDRAAPPTQHADAHATTSAAGRPVLPRDAAWAGVMIIVILGGFFLPAAVIGPIARALAPDEEPEPTSHHDHDHGHGGGGAQHGADAHAHH